MKLYQYPNCSTCRKAIKFLNENQIPFESIDITEQPPTLDELSFMLEQQAGALRSLFNTSGLQYRELNMKETLPQLSNDEALALLADNGKLIKRPFLVTPQLGLVGFKLPVWQDRLL